MTCPINPDGINMCIERMVYDFAMIGVEAGTTCRVIVSATPTGELHERPAPCTHGVDYYVRPTREQVDKWNADSEGRVVRSLLAIIDRDLSAYGRAS